MKMTTLGWVAFILVIVGGLNWGLVAFDFNLVSFLVGTWPTVEKAVYVLVALSAVFLVLGGGKKNEQAM